MTLESHAGGAMIVTFPCELAGGILAADPAVLRRWDRDVVAEFALALDPAGKTDIPYDYPPGDWGSTWRRETQGLVTRCNQGEMAFLVLHEGLFSLDVDVGGGKEIKEEWSAEFQSRLLVSSGEVAVAEADKLMENWSRRPRREEYYRVFPLANGDYMVRFVIVNDPERTCKEERVFGTPDRPAIFVQVVPQRGKVPELKELPHYSFL